MTQLAEMSEDERWDLQRGELIKDSEAAAKPDRKAPAAKTEFSCTDPAGITRTFSSSTRAPTRAVAILPLVEPLPVPGYLERYQLVGWCETPEGAQLLADCFTRKNRYAEVVILEVK